MGPMPGSITYEGCALVNHLNLSAPRSADSAEPHCRVVVTARSSGIIWCLAHALGLVIKELGVPPPTLLLTVCFSPATVRGLPLRSHYTESVL